MKRIPLNPFFRSLLFLLLLPLTFLVSCSKDDESDPDNFNKDRSLNKKGLGTSAHELLSADKYQSVVVEMQYVAGFAPTPAAVNNLKTFMEALLNKPEGVTMKLKEIPAGGKTSYRIEDIKHIEDQYREEFNRPGQIAIYFFFADGEYAGNTGGGKVLGQAHRNTSMVLYQKTIQELSGGLTQPPRSTLETVILEHELGHILGLVNVGTPMVTNHQDASHGAHCTNTDCLMYWGVETGDVVQNLLGGNMPVLDQNCLNDLKNNGGK